MEVNTKVSIGPALFTVFRNFAVWCILMARDNKNYPKADFGLLPVDWNVSQDFSS